MFKPVVRRLKRNLINFPSKKVPDKVVLFESDDWGSIRMPSTSVYQKLLAKNYISEKDRFSKLDSVESNEDLELLFEVLQSVKDSRGNAAVLTADTIVANPDFEAIKEANFERYFFESADCTLARYQNSDRVLGLWQEGAKLGIYTPQLHGREHLNIAEWLQALQNNRPDFNAAFEMGTFALNSKIAAAFNASNRNEAESHKSIIEDAQKLFEQFFGKKSETFIAPNYTWPESLESVLKTHSVIALQGSRIQNRPDLKGGMNRVTHYTGQSSRAGQSLLVRNCLFEPSISPEADYVNACLRNISNAFYWKAPAIVGTHRINFVSRNDVRNRDQNLKAFKALLKEIVKRWPEVRFMSTDSFVKEYIL